MAGRTYRNYNNFEDGNTARKYYEIPEEQPKQAPKKIPKQAPNSGKKPKKQLGVLNFSYMLFLISMVLVLIFFSFSFVKANTNFLVSKKVLDVKERELNTLVSKNNATRERLDSEVDLGEIYRIATEQLGMIYATDDQVITYDASNPDYVKKYQDID